jgi:aspartyl/glutamyl-tRNA(Asn/Gln) amidotransferase C subunit
MITTADIQKLAELSRIKIVPEEQESLRSEIESILGYIDQIKKVAKVSGSAAESLTLKAGALRNVMREDGEPHQAGSFTEKVLSGTPLREGNYLKVKKIM